MSKVVLEQGRPLDQLSRRKLVTSYFLGALIFPKNFWWHLSLKFFQKNLLCSSTKLGLARMMLCTSLSVTISTFFQLLVVSGRLGLLEAWPIPIGGLADTQKERVILLKWSWIQKSLKNRYALFLLNDYIISYATFKSFLNIFWPDYLCSEVTWFL